MSTLIITSPHMLCPLDKKRKCDLAASISADTLCSEIKRHKINYVYLPGDQYRANYDLNRSSSRKTEFRQTLSNIFLLFRNNALTIDVHSFPNYWVKEAKDINFFKENEIPPDIVVLEGKLNTYDNVNLSETFLSCLQKAGLNSKIIRGIKVNDIMNESSDHNIPSVLFEFNEKYTNDTEGLHRICSCLVQTIKSLMDE